MAIRIGTRQDNILQGGNGFDLLAGLSGDDQLAGLGGSDLLFGGAGKDALQGGAGRDKLFGGRGDDDLDGGDGDDRLFGGSGDDVLKGGEGDDYIDGGSGEDTAVYDGASTDYDIQVITKHGRITGFVVTDLNTADGDDGRDTLKWVETLVFKGDGVTVSPATSIQLLDASGAFQGFFATIQDAVDAASDGGTIRIPSGDYREQVVIDGINDLTIRSEPGAHVTISAPDELLQTGVDPQNGRVIHGNVTIKNATGVVLKDITVDGRANGDGITVAGGDFVGVAVLDAGAELFDVDVTGFRFALDPSGDLSGIQRGTGILASNAEGDQEELIIDGGRINDFQKNGITLRNVDADIHGTDIDGGGVQSIIAQNGIQAEAGTTGRIKGVDVSDIGFAGAGSVASLMLIFDADELDLIGNSLTGAGGGATVGLFLTDGSGMRITRNDISDVDFGFFENITRDGLEPNKIGTFGALANGYADITNEAYSLLVNPDVTDDIVRADGTSEKDGFIGAAGDDVFFGFGGDDFLFGDFGNDTLKGGDGADILEGAAGADLLKGGQGADQFVFAEGDGGMTAADADTVLDYDLADDEIGLAFGLTFADLTITDEAGNAVISVTATGEILATVRSIQAADLDADEFVLI